MLVPLYWLNVFLGEWEFTFILLPFYINILQDFKFIFTSRVLSILQWLLWITEIKWSILSQDFETKKKIWYILVFFCSVKSKWNKLLDLKKLMKLKGLWVDNCKYSNILFEDWRLAFVKNYFNWHSIDDSKNVMKVCLEILFY